MSLVRLTIDQIKANIPYACVGGPFGSDLTTRDYVDEGVPVIRGGNLSGDSGFIDSNFVFVSDEKANALSSNLGFPGDIVFTQRGTLGQVGLIPLNAAHGRYVISQSQMKLTVNQDIVLPEYVFWWFRQPQIVELVKQRAITSGVPHINLGILKSLTIKIPSLTEQRKILAYLCSISEHIENNRRRIALLEQSARLLYREWFVHLRFPGHEHVNVVNGVPEGWKMKPLGDLHVEVRVSVKPENIVPGIPYIGLEHMPRRSITLNEWGKSEDIFSQKFVYRENDILFGKIRPYFHKVGFALTDGITSSDAIVIRASENIFYYYLLMIVSSDRFVSLASKTVKEGSKMPRADWKHLKRHLVTVPPNHLLVEYNDFCAPILNQLKSLSVQTKKLCEARDLLLPRLMSGEIEV